VVSQAGQSVRLERLCEALRGKIIMVIVTTANGLRHLLSERMEESDDLEPLPIAVGGERDGLRERVNEVKDLDIGQDFGFTDRNERAPSRSHLSSSNGFGVRTVEDGLTLAAGPASDSLPLGGRTEPLTLERPANSTRLYVTASPGAKEPRTLPKGTSQLPKVHAKVVEHVSIDVPDITSCASSCTPVCPSMARLSCPIVELAESVGSTPDNSTDCAPPFLQRASPEGSDHRWVDEATRAEPDWVYYSHGREGVDEVSSRSLAGQLPHPFPHLLIAWMRIDDRGKL